MFEKARPMHQQTFIPVYTDVKMEQHEQLLLPIPSTNNMYSSYEAHVKMGQFYEMLTKALFGGYLCDSVIDCNKNGYKGFIKPDIINSTMRTAYESKANASGHQMNLINDQIERYKIFSILNENYRVYFCFYRHGYKKVMRTTLSPYQLYKKLARKTYACIVLPFDVVFKIWRSEVFQKYKLNTWPACTRVGSKFMNLFLFDPQKALNELKLDITDFKIGRFVSSGISIEKHRLEEFLIVTIESLRYFDWQKELTQEIPF